MVPTLLPHILPDLGDIARAEYRDAFISSVAKGIREPLVIPYCLLGPFVITPLYLTFAHTNRPWLFHARWLVLAFVFVFDINLIRTVSSMNVACAYAAGLMGTWGIMSAMNLLVWTRPQFEFARVVKVEKKDLDDSTAFDGPPVQANGKTPEENGLRHRRLDNTATISSNGAIKDSQLDNSPSSTVYVWQPFPDNGTFWERFNWTMDLATSFRLIGWNSSIPSVPRPDIPHEIFPGDAVSFDNMPVITQSGYRRPVSKSDFLWSRIRILVIMYPLLDFLAVFMMKDPYFVYGPGHGFELNPFLRSLPGWLLFTYREIVGLAGIYSALQAIFNVHDIIQFYFFRYSFPVRGEFWQYTSIFGSFSQVLDKGLAGWWGSWWHQTFRAQFVAPARYLVRHGYLDKQSISAQFVASLVSFLQSGMLHAAGSVSSMRSTRIWHAPVFFFLQPPGVLIQLFFNKLIDAHVPQTPRVVRRLLNLVFTMAWLQLTSRPFLSDMASAGIWLLEPVPFSFLRMAGFGHPDDNWWRWGRSVFPSWHSDEKWWKSGLQI